MIIPHKSDLLIVLFFNYFMKFGGASDIMVIVIGSGLSCQSSNSEQGCLHFTALEKGMDPVILLPAWGK